MSWFAVDIVAPSRHTDIVATLIEAGAPGVQEDGVRLVSHFSSESNARRVAQTVAAMEGVVNVRVDAVRDVDWTVAWRAHMRSFEIRDLTIAPPWLAAGLDSRSTVIIDPGMAFGTGDHASTRGAVRLLQECVRPGDVVADVGTGSGILAIAAVKCGAQKVIAIDVDADVMRNARENIERNRVEDAVHVIDGDAAVILPLIGPVDVVLANITASVLSTLLPVASSVIRPGGRIVVAGILEAESQSFSQMALSAGWCVAIASCEDDWWSALLERT